MARGWLGLAAWWWTWRAAWGLVSSSGARVERGRPAYLFEFVRQKSAEVSELIEQKKREDLETVAKFQAGLEKSRSELVAAIMGSSEGRLEELEEALLMADVGIETTEQILSDVRRSGVGEARELKSLLRGRLLQVLEEGGDRSLGFAVEGPTVVTVVGSNGMGKTTTVGKLAKRLRESGSKVLVAACDTYRAAAVDQLAEWTRRAEVDLFTTDASQPAAVAFRALDQALAGDYDVVLVDTSGRLANNVALTEELKKIQRTIAKKIPGAPHETLVVLDASVGRNALDQARIWRDECGASGIVVTKLDGTSRAGFCVSVVGTLGLPVKLVGVGEAVDDLRDFDPPTFVDALLDLDPATSAGLADEFQRQLARLDAAPPEPAAPEPASAPARPAKKNKKKSPAAKKKNKSARRRR
mmetsp:Transcript_6553/g.19933  ORF Transcript_6553/g.19933 Transcript_6553/m.19933 type:complete len:413 (-) Transcript_6553:1661-2899(-)